MQQPWLGRSRLLPARPVIPNSQPAEIKRSIKVLPRNDSVSAWDEGPLTLGLRIKKCPVESGRPLFTGCKHAEEVHTDNRDRSEINSEHCTEYAIYSTFCQRCSSCGTLKGGDPATDPAARLLGETAPTARFTQAGVAGEGGGLGQEGAYRPWRSQGRALLGKRPVQYPSCERGGCQGGTPRTYRSEGESLLKRAQQGQHAHGDRAVVRSHAGLGCSAQKDRTMP